jgi:hypothetical protein
MFRRSTGSETEFEELDDDDESPLVPEDSQAAAKKARRPTLIHYPPIPRSLSGRRRQAEMSLREAAVQHGEASRLAMIPPAGRRP